MRTLFQSRGLAPHSCRAAFRQPPRVPRRGRAGLVRAVALLALGALAACEQRGSELATGVSAGPARSTIPTTNTSTLEVRIEKPANGATVSGTVSIEVRTKEDDVRRARTDLFIGEELVTSNTAERFTYSWSTAGYEGTRSITAVGWDVEGNSALAAITVTVPSSSTEPPPPSEPAVLSVAVSPDTVTAGEASIGTVVLDGPAPPGGTAVSLVSNRTAVATVPPSATVPEGETTTTFTVTSHPVASPDWAAISANAGGVTQTTVLWVLPAGVTIDSLTLNPTLVASGETSEGTVKLTGPAPDGGASVALSSSNTERATVPPSVTVPAGATTATFTVTAGTVASNVSVTISAAYGGVTRSASLTVAPPPPGEGQLASLTISPDQVVGGESSQGTVTLGAAAGSDTQVTLTSTDVSVATVPSSVTVPAGATSATFTITTLPNNTGTGQFAVISGQAGGVTRSASITTVGAPSGPAISSVGLFPSSVGGGGPVTGIVTFDGSLADGVILSFTSSHPEIVQVPPEGVQVIWSSTQRAFPVTTSPVSSSTVVTITATACCGGVGQATATLTVTTDPPPPPDGVQVKDARWIPGGRGGTLEVRATSTSTTAILTVFRGGTDIKLMTLTHVGGGKYEGTQSFGGGATNPGTIDVRSNLGGSATSNVKE